MSPPVPALTHQIGAGGSVLFNDAEADVECAADETILFAGLRAGLALPYECASGGCGTCRARLVAGQVANRWPGATGLSERDRRKGDRILMCQSVPDGPCHLRVPIRDAAPGEPRPARLMGRLAERELLTADIARFVIGTGRPFPYLPGQFVQLEFADGVRRAYSMTHPKRHHRQTKLELLVRAKPGGAASGWLFSRLCPGADLVVEGPYGRAYAQSQPDRPVVCLAGGTGLAPVLAIAGQLAAEAPDRALRLYVGARRAQDLVLTDRLAALAGSGVTVILVTEQECGATLPRLGRIRTGLALDHLARDITDLSGHDVYVAGPTPMIDATLRRLVRDGTASADQIFFDRFIV
jgi:NAD(P)H-flavin reductase/ferredoxin